MSAYYKYFLLALFRAVKHISFCSLFGNVKSNLLHCEHKLDLKMISGFTRFVRSSFLWDVTQGRFVS